MKHRQIGKGIDVFGFAAGNRKDMMNVQIGRQVSELGLLNLPVVQNPVKLVGVGQILDEHPAHMTFEETAVMPSCFRRNLGKYNFFKFHCRRPSAIVVMSELNPAASSRPDIYCFVDSFCRLPRKNAFSSADASSASRPPSTSGRW